jgi:TorA maturation chaperone TorD
VKVTVHCNALLATLLARSPDAQLLSVLADLRGDASPLGQAHVALAEAARQSSEESAAREYFALFAGLKDDALLPYASHYLADTLYGRPLARLRDKLELLGIEKAPEWQEPEDHAAFLCEIMAKFGERRYFCARRHGANVRRSTSRVVDQAFLYRP